MALTSEITVYAGLKNRPAAYSVPATTITFSGTTHTATGSYSTAAPALDDSDPVAGITAVVAAVKTYVDGTFIPTSLGIDTTGNTVNAIITVTSVSRSHGTSVYSDTDNYVIGFSVEWEIS